MEESSHIKKIPSSILINQVKVGLELKGVPNSFSGLAYWADDGTINWAKET